jgi:hypothetical protein
MTPEEINMANVKFWEKIKAYQDQPEILSAIIKQWQEIGSIAQFRGDPPISIEQITHIYAEIHGASQTKKATKPRPKAAPTIRSETIAAMRPWRRCEESLCNFLDAAKTGSEAVSIQPAGLSGVKRFTVQCDTVEKNAPAVAYSTLKEWWAQAAK